MADKTGTQREQCAARDDLSFTDFGTKRADRNWSVPHDESANFDNCTRLGGYFFAEIVELATCNEAEAFDAIRFALTSSGWRPEFGIEVGFAAELAAAAIVGLRAIQEGGKPYTYASKKKRLTFGWYGPIKNNKLKGG